MFAVRMQASRSASRAPWNELRSTRLATGKPERRAYSFGATLTTRVCTYFRENEKAFPPGLEAEDVACLGRVEREVGKRFGDPANPLLLSVPSGAPASMPGMTARLEGRGVVRRARRRPRLDPLLPPGRARRCVVLALPRADRALRGGARGARRGLGQGLPRQRLKD
jgi:hypothetical protein